MSVAPVATHARDVGQVPEETQPEAPEAGEHGGDDRPSDKSMPSIPSPTPDAEEQEPPHAEECGALHFMHVYISGEPRQALRTDLFALLADSTRQCLGYG